MSYRFQQVVLYYSRNRWTYLILIHAGILESLFCISMSENGFSELGRSPDQYKSPRGNDQRVLKEIITMQADEFFATYIDIGNDS